MKRYSVPVIKRYIVPHAKKAAYNTYRDIMKGSDIRSTLQRNSLGLVQDIGNDVIENLKQKGRGIRRKRISVKSSPVKKSRTKLSSRTKRKPKKPQSKPRQLKKKRKSKSSPISKRDIFS